MRKLIILFALLISSIYGYSVGYPTVGGVSYVVDTVAHYKVGPGTNYAKLHFIHQRSPLWVYVYEVELSNPYVKIKTETSTGLMTGMERISSIAQRLTTEGKTYFAGVNGDFYNTKTGEPINGFATEKIIGSIPYGSRPCFTITDDAVPFIDILKFSGTLKTTASSSQITRTNAGRGENELVLYNYLQGASTNTNVYGTEILLELQEGDWSLAQGVKKAKVIKKEVGVGNMAITKGNVVLSGNGSAKTFLDGINVDDIVEVTLALSLSSGQIPTGTLSEVVGGDRLILKDGQLAGENWAELHPRTAVGFNSDKSKAYFAVVDGRGASVGVTTHTLGEILRMSGASDGLNLDGGGSSGMYFNKYGIVNVGSDGYERSVSNGIFAVSSAPTDNEITSLGFMKSYYELPVYSTMKPIIVGYNKYGHIVSTDVPATLSCSSELGSVDANGFTGGGQTVTGILTASYNGASGQVPVHIVNDGGAVKIALDSVLIDTRKEYLIEVKSFFNENEYPINPKALTWTVLNPSVCSVIDGVVKGLMEGQTLAIGEFAGEKDTLLIKVQPIVENPYIQTDFSNSEDFKLSASTENLTNITFNSDNLPQGWTSGTRLNFHYTKDRYSTLTLNYLPKLYSLADSLTITLNSGTSTISKLSLSFIANNESMVRTFEGTGLELGKDFTFGLDLKKYYSSDKLANYPLSLLNINLSLQDSKHTTNTNYDVFLKDIKLYYSAYPSGIEESISGSGKISISPNPVRDGYAILNLESENINPLRVNIYSVSGQLFKTAEFDVADSSQYSLPVSDLVKGLYLVSVIQEGGVRETVKLIVE